MAQIIHLKPLRPAERSAELREGVRVETVTIAWMVIEAIVAIFAGFLARSVLLTAFGFDSVIELVSGGALFWRLRTESRETSLERVEWAENRAAWISGVGLGLLCVYIVAISGVSLLSHNRPDGSPVGIGLAVAALLVMPVLVMKKRRIAAKIDSPALRADAACSLICAYMAATLLVGLALTTLLGWWWADLVAALALLYWIVPETREALEGARAGHGGCGCGDSPDSPTA
jgi:divalent metal cation (Fe/Co/Zn/Cd) transporter